MADLQKFRSHEALNTTAAGKYSVADASSGGLGGSSGASPESGMRLELQFPKTDRGWVGEGPGIILAPQPKL